jgi:hypothetical protein
MEVGKTIQFYKGAEDEDLDEEQKEQLRIAEEDYLSLQKQILEKDYNLEQMYNQSADAKSEQHLMKWFTLECSFYHEKVFSKEANKIIEQKFELFEGSNFDERHRQFNLFLEEIDEQDDEELTDRKKLIVEALPTINKVLSLWYKQLATDQKTIEKALKEYFPEQELDGELSSEEAKEDIDLDKDEEPKKKKASKKKTSKKKTTSEK